MNEGDHRWYMALVSFLTWFTTKPILWHPIRTSAVIGGELTVHNALTFAVGYGLPHTPVLLVDWAVQITLTTLLLKWVLESLEECAIAASKSYRNIRKRYRK